MMAELTGICVTDHFTGESGKGKSQLDGHFGVKGSKLRHAVAAALHDVITPQKLFEGVSRTLGQNEKAQLFQADRSEGSTLDVDSVKQLSSMSHREYVYAEAGGAFETIVLRQQSWLGKGLRVEAAKMRKPGAASGFKLPRELAAAGSTGGAPSGAMTAAAQKQARAAGRSSRQPSTSAAAGGGASARRAAPAPPAAPTAGAGPHGGVGAAGAQAWDAEAAAAAAAPVPADAALADAPTLPSGQPAGTLLPCLCRGLSLSLSLARP